MNYRFADRVVASSMALPELQQVRVVTPDWRLDMHSPGPLPSRRSPFHFWQTARGQRTVSFARVDDQLLMHFARTGWFVADFEARVVHVHPLALTKNDALRVALVNQVLPLLLGDERLVLHASAVAGTHGALVFVGPPGSGKSTLAAALALRGLPLITDDCLVIDQCDGTAKALPSGVAPRLWPDSINAMLPGQLRRFARVCGSNSKRRITGGVPVAVTAAPIAQLYVLSSGDTTHAIQPLAPAAAVPALTAATFLGQIDARASVRAAFERVTSVVTRVAAARLVPARRFDRLDALCDAIIARAC